MSTAQPSVVETAPVTTPGHPGSMNFVIESSKAFISSFGLKINAGVFEGRFFNLTYPKALEDDGLPVTFTLVGVAGGELNLLGIGAGTEVGDFQVAIQTSDVDAQTRQLTCTITSKTLGAINQQCELRAKVPTARHSWNLQLGTPSNNNFTLNYLACDPQAKYASPAQPPATPSAFEQVKLTLTANGADAGSIIGPTPPAGADWTPHYVWDFQGDIAITSFPITTTVNTTDTGPNPDDDKSPLLPGVYEPVPIRLKLRTTFGDSGGTPFLDNRVEDDDRPELTIKAQPQHVVFVLDRSGSMNGDGPPTRYDNAKLATKMFTHLLFALREDVNADDKIGIVTFTDDGGYHQLPVSPKVKTIMGLTALAQAKDDVLNPATVNFEAPDTNTPIGDGLVAGLDLLATGGGTTDRSMTLALLTDGIANAGTVFVGPTDPSTVGNHIRAYTGNELTADQKKIRDKLAETGRQFVIPLGAQVDDLVLAALAGPHAYVPVTDARNLASAFGDILHFSQEVDKVPTTRTADVTDLAVYIRPVNASADRLLFAVLGGFPTGHSIRVESFTNGNWNVQVGPVVKTISTEEYQVGWVPDFQKVAGKPTQWRVTHLDADGKAVSMPADQVLAYEDLHVKADVVLDKADYQTGDEMNLTVRVRHNDQPILGATVHAELVAPAVGTGEALSGLGSDFQPWQGKGGVDVPPLLGQMIGETMRRHEWRHWPHEEPKGLFIDGTEDLHDVDNDGNYTNTFARVWKEGRYTWNLTVEGTDTEGNAFARSLTISTLASVKVDPRASKVKLDPIHNHPSKLRAVRVSVTPQDVRHERLGPGRDNLVFWALKGGEFEHVHNGDPAPVFTDGSYQRVVLYRLGQHPTVQVEAAGVLLPQITIPAWILV
ncbi:VWA domain-containing protein [Actinophytocola sp.]|uniref:VWA domain-containing protein n=1 Tax=Actinophytocola sp. TaxID=1872138 RepID=UPI00389B115E